MKDQQSINGQIKEAERELAAIDVKRAELQDRIKQLQSLKQSIADEQLPFNRRPERNLTNESDEKQKIAVFRSLFRGREDVFPRRFESKRTGKSGYQPVCRNEWIKPFCQKPKVKCGECEQLDFTPITDDVIRKHLVGIDPTDRYQREYVIGVYPMLLDETCWFLVVDFDKETWMEDSRAYLKTSWATNVPAVLERSRSGNGGHIWIFFSESIPAKLARQLGAFIMTQAMESRPEMGFDSYDRFFPSQDTLPKGGFGNLIALPLQKKPREKGNSLFVDENLNPYPDQWDFLSTVRKMNLAQVQSVVDKAAYRGGILGVRFVSGDEDEISPWLYSPSGRKPKDKISGPLPDQIELVLGNQIYISKENLPPALKNRLIPLIITERKKHLEKLKNLLEGKIRKIIIMKGGMGKKQRRATLNEIENISDGEEKVILATGRYLGEGFDEQRLDTLFLTLPISWRGTLSQYAGRLHRTHRMKDEVVIYDYADLEVPMLSRMYERRVRGYQSIGYKIVE